MWIRRLAYLLLLVAAYIFFIFYKMWLSWYILILVIALPILSLIMCIVSFIKFKPNSFMPTKLKHNDIAEISIGSNDVLSKKANHKLADDDDDKSFWFCNYVATFDVFDYMADKTVVAKYKSQGQRDFCVKIDTDHVGAYRYTFKSIKFYDLFGIFSFKKKVGTSHELMIRPRKRVPAVMPKLDNFRTRSLKKSNSQYSEIYDIRDYVIGDSTKNIHWKMSAKKDSILVKEPLEENLENARLLFELVPNRDDMDKRLSELIYISEYFVNKGVNHRVDVVPPYNRNVHYEIFTNSDIETMSDAILFMKLPSKSAASVTSDVKKDDANVEGETTTADTPASDTSDAATKTSAIEEPATETPATETPAPKAGKEGEA